MKTGDVNFDQKFSVHGQAPVQDGELRHRIARQQGDGVLTVWNGRAARYALVNPTALAEPPEMFAGTLEGDAPLASVVSLLNLLADVIEASLPPESE